MLRLLRTERLAWALAAFYFLTFGGFVAFSVYLPLLLRDEFGLTLSDAGFRTAGFVVVAALMRPIGGWLSDRIGGSRVLSGVFAGHHSFRAADVMDVHRSVHCGRSRLRGPAGPRKRRSLQARSAIFPE